MRTFCLKVTGWMVAGVLFAVASVGVNRLLLPYHALMLAPGDPSVLVLGDSHAASGVDPGLWEGGVSLARNGEPLHATYHKMKFVLEANPGIRSVVLSFGPANVAAANGLWWGDPSQADYLMSGLVGIAPLWGIEGVHIGTAFSVHLRHWWTPNLHMIEDLIAHRRGVPVVTHPYSSGFWSHSSLSVLTTDGLEYVIDRQYGLTGLADAELASLDSIADWVSRSEIDLTIVSTPLHPRYRALIPDEVEVAFDSIRSDLDARPGVTVVDLRALALPDSAYRDFDHVNAYGVSEVTDALRRTLTRD